MLEVAVIGAGASGMMAAITAAADPCNHITVFERQGRVGRKLSVTGNGRCNLTNRHASVQHYHGSCPSFVSPALRAFSAESAVALFGDLGLLTVTEPDGKVYPYTDQANSVVDVLRFALQKNNITLKTGCEITVVRKTKAGFILKCGGESFACDRLIVSAGGLAGTKFGGSLSGYGLLRSLGHHCTKLTPSLVQLCTEENIVKGLKGVRVNAAVELLSGEARLAESGGEVQFTEYGLSGPAIFEISREAARAVNNCTVQLNLLPEFSEEQLLSALCVRISVHPEMEAGDLLTGFLHNRLGRVLLHEAGISEKTVLRDLTWENISRAVSLSHCLRFSVTDTMGMDHAQVTCGGICTEEFDAETLESRIVPGLYATGEVLDIDGDCGGFNLQWAWSSGYLAGLLKGGALC